MLKSLSVENFTAFKSAHLSFGKNLNVFVGENGTGKTHLLKAAYTAIAVNAGRTTSLNDEALSKSELETRLAAKLLGVFRPDHLGRLVRRKVGRGKCTLQFEFDNPRQNLSFTFSTVAKSKVVVTRRPSIRMQKMPVYLPTRELLSIYPGFVSLFETSQLPFEETWRDTCILLGAPLARGPRDKKIHHMLAPLQKSMGGKIVLNASGRFYLALPSGSMEMHLVAEGLRKLATIARLIATGSLLSKGYLFWDEPETNLNPRILRAVARSIVDLAHEGIQVFVATHSLFLLRELHILQRKETTPLDARYFGLQAIGREGVRIEQGALVDSIGALAALDEELQQSERYLEVEVLAGSPKR